MVTEEDVRGSGMNREQLESLEETAQLLQDAGYDLRQQERIDYAADDLRSAAAAIREGDLAGAADNFENAAEMLDQWNTDLLGSQIHDAGEELENFIQGER